MPLKTVFLALAVLGCMAVSSEVRADVLYDSGAPSGMITGVNIGYANQVADSFTLSQASIVTGVNFTSWDYPGGSLSDVGYALESSPVVPTALTEAAITSSSYLFTQQPNGYQIDENSFSTSPTTLTAGTYYLVLGSATGTGGGFWDENDGASSSYGPFGQNAGQSEAFQVTGTAVSAAPEPSTWLLMFAGIGGIGLTLRQAKRKMGVGAKDALAGRNLSLNRSKEAAQERSCAAAM